MAGAGVLEPLDESLPPQVRSLAGELRILFAGLGVSVTRYAATVHMDEGVVSRYLSGGRLPHWQFVHELLVPSTVKRNGVPPTQEVIGHLKGLHQAALEAGGSPLNHIVLLQERLSEADTAVNRVRRREQDLEEALQAAQHRIADRDVTARELSNTLDHR